jgi:hypothetical protein
MEVTHAAVQFSFCISIEDESFTGCARSQATPAPCQLASTQALAACYYGGEDCALPQMFDLSDDK